MLINASASGQQSIGTLIILGGQNLPQGLGHEVMAQWETTDNADSDGLDKNALTVKHPARKAWTFLASPLFRENIIGLYYLYSIMYFMYIHINVKVKLILFLAWNS